MHHHHWWDSLSQCLIQLTITGTWMSMQWWIAKLEIGGHLLTALAPYLAAIIAGLQIAYLIRKHMRLGK